MELAYLASAVAGAETWAWVAMVATAKPEPSERAVGLVPAEELGVWASVAGLAAVVEPVLAVKALLEAVVLALATLEV